MGEVTGAYDSIHKAAEAISAIASTEPAEQAQEEVSNPPAETPERVEAQEEEVQEEVQEEPVAQEEPSKEAEEVEQRDTEEVELEPAQLASFLGVDEDDLFLNEEGSIQMKAKVDGKLEQVSLRDLRDSYQLAKTSQQRLQKLSEEKKAFDKERKETLETLANQQNYMTQALQAIEEQYANDWKQTDWNRLREDDSETYVRLRQDYEDRKRQVEEFKKTVEKNQQDLVTKYSEDLQKRWQDGSQRLDELFTGPDYHSSPKWGQEEKDRLVKWMKEQGFPEEDFVKIGAWQIFKWARDSMLRGEERSKAKETVKRVVKLPKLKTSKPGPKQDIKKVARKNAVQEAKARQRKSGGDLRSTTDLISKLFEG